MHRNRNAQPPIVEQGLAIGSTFQANHRFPFDLTASAHKAALEAEARIAEVREQAARSVENIGETILAFWERVGGPPGNGYVPFTGAIAAQIIRAIPNPSGDRFMALLEDMRILLAAIDNMHERGETFTARVSIAVAAARQTLAAFPQPEEQP